MQELTSSYQIQDPGAWPGTSQTYVDGALQAYDRVTRLFAHYHIDHDHRPELWVEEATGRNPVHVRYQSNPPRIYITPQALLCLSDDALEPMLAREFAQHALYMGFANAPDAPALGAYLHTIGIDHPNFDPRSVAADMLVNQLRPGLGNGLINALELIKDRNMEYNSHIRQTPSPAPGFMPPARLDPSIGADTLSTSDLTQNELSQLLGTAPPRTPAQQALLIPPTNVRY